MRPEVIALFVAIVGVVVGRRIARRWVRDRWLDDTLSSRQAAILFWLLAAGPLLLIGLIVVISDPRGAVILGALLVFVLLPLTTLLVAAVDYRPTRALKERQRQTDGGR
jgi:hypothetical protein